jgi:hypothetical protein
MKTKLHLLTKGELQVRYVLIIAVALLLAILVTGCAQQGNMGVQGIPGIDGSPGTPGADGTKVTTVQFCPYQGPTTHSHFPEQGICINGKIIAAYWDGSNAFLAEVVPGTYISTSTGLQCTFTVTNGCNIQ